jgi:uncharacterized protein YcnI
MSTAAHRPRVMEGAPLRLILRTAAGAGAALVVMLVLAPAALAHARVSPAVSLSGQLQLYSLAVPTEKAGLTTSKIVLAVPKGFGIDSFVPALGWKRQVQQQGSGDSAVVERVTWKGGNVPTGEDSLFQFLGQPASSGTYTFQVVQTYSDGSIVDWSGSDSSAAPAPTIKAVSSIGGGSGSTLAIVGIVLGVIALIIACAGLFLGGGTGGKREIA